MMVGEEVMGYFDDRVCWEVVGFEVERDSNIVVDVVEWEE